MADTKVAGSVPTVDPRKLTNGGMSLAVLPRIFDMTAPNDG